MKTKSKLNFFGALLMMALFFVGSNKCLAQESQEGKLNRILENAPVVETVTVATVDLINVKLISKEGNDLKISFDLSNKLGVQDNVRYFVELRNFENNQLVDKKIYDESLFLGENQSVQREIAYNIPKYLTGKFRVVLMSQNENGLIFGGSIVGEVEVLATEKSVYFDPVSCLLKISGDDQSFAPNQGVDVSSEEELTLHCSVYNSYEAEINATPHFKTTLRTAFGKTIAEENGEPIRLASGEKREITFAIPKVKSPQAYDVVVSLLGDGNKLISNSIVIHYVIQGASGTIQNITLNKDAYNKGDTASISFYWTGRADDFPRSRRGQVEKEKIFARIEAMRGDGRKCAEAFFRGLSTQYNGKKEDINIPITDDCQDGKVIFALLDEKGNKLDEKIFKLQASAASATEEKNKSLPLAPYALAGLALLIGMAAIIWAAIKRKKRENMAGILTLFLFASSFLFATSVKAGSFAFLYDNKASFTYTLSGYSSIGSDGIPRYCANDIMTMFTTAQWNGCSNDADSVATSFYRIAGSGTGACHPINPTQNTNTSGSCSVNAPSTPGYFDANVKGAVFDYHDWSENSAAYYSSGDNYVRYRVDTRVNGACGTIPTYCSSGDMSGMNQVGTNLFWTCNGRVNEACPRGTDASCSAPAPVCGNNLPGNATACANANIYVPLGASWHPVSGCTGAKCEYVCNGGFVSDGSSCVAPSCQGSDPVGASTLCSGDTTGLTGNVNKTVVPFSSDSSTCTTATKCEYICNNGLVPNATNTACIAPQCTPNVRPNATLCPGDNIGLVSNMSSVSVLSCSEPSGSDPKCEYACNAGACLKSGVCTLPGPKVYTCSPGTCQDINCGSSVPNSCVVTDNCSAPVFALPSVCVANSKPCADQTPCPACPLNKNWVETNP